MNVSWKTVGNVKKLRLYVIVKTLKSEVTQRQRRVMGRIQGDILAKKLRMRYHKTL